MKSFKRFSQGDSVHGHRCQDHRVALLKADNEPIYAWTKASESAKKQMMNHSAANVNVHWI